MSESNDSSCSADRLWSDENKCGDLPLSFALLIAIAVGWVALFVVAGIRMIYLMRSAAFNTTVGKKMQLVQAWFYSLIHTIVSLVVLFSAGALLYQKEYPTAGFLMIFYVIDLAYTSQIDVIGTYGRNQGINNISLSIMLEYLSTTYLAKAVWKLSGHREDGQNSNQVDDAQKKESKLSKLCCLSPLHNGFSPRVEDFKDVVSVQGALLSLPTLATLYLTIVRSNGVSSEGNDEFKLNPLEKALASLAFISTIMSPVLGDWETYSKSILYCSASALFRALEVVARLSFYVYFLDFSRFAGLILLGAEYAFMWLTSVNVANPSSAGRIGSVGHKLFVSWEAVFFTNFRRVHVDKEMVQQNLTLMPTTIEMLRFLERTVATFIGYVIIAAGGVPHSYKEVIDNVESMPIIFFAGVAANGVVVVFNIINFFIVNRKDLSKSHIIMIKSYWMSFYPCRCICGSSTAHVNRDNLQYHATDEGVLHYV